jgi:hypothetical protein
MESKTETIAEANKRDACLNCGISGGKTFLLDDGRTVRACEDCLKGPSKDWLFGEEIPSLNLKCFRTHFFNTRAQMWEQYPKDSRCLAVIEMLRRKNNESN